MYRLEQGITLATTNKGKIREFRNLLECKNITVHSPPDMLQATESASTFVENALIKARCLAQRVDTAILADDSGLCVVALDHAPGIYSARYAGERATSSDNIELLLKRMTDYPHQRQAFFHCALVLIRHRLDPVPIIVQAQWHGTIAQTEIGHQGFGYDPVFLPNEYSNVSAAQLLPSKKNKISHRGKAMAQLLLQLEIEWAI